MACRQCTASPVIANICSWPPITICVSLTLRQAVEFGETTAILYTNEVKLNHIG